MLSEEGQAKIAVSLFNAFMNYKATEEGTNKPANVVYNIKGYVSPTAEKAGLPAEPKPTVVVVEEAPSKAEAEPAEQPQPPVVVKADPEPKAEAPAAEPKQQAEEPVVEAVKPVVTPAEKPTPEVALPVQEAPKQPAKPTLQQPQHTAAEDATQFYTVQFLVAPVLYKAGATQLDGITDFTASRKAQTYVYTTGRFATFNEASQYCNHLHSTTRFSDAWVFLNKQAPAPAAAKPEPAPATAKPATTQQATASGVSYRVQFATANRQMKAGDPDLHGIKDFRYAQSGKLYMYTAGNYTSLSQARERCRQIQSTTPFKDAFVIAIYQGQRISLERAAALTKNKK